jgi:hypothetical protein
MIERNPKILALRRRYPRFYAQFGLPEKTGRRWTLSPAVENRLQGFLLLVGIGLILNYSYYERLSLQYLFVGGVQEWFRAMQRLLDEGFGAGRNYNALYVAINGAYYGFLFARGSLLLQAMLTAWRRSGTWLLACALTAVVYLVIVLPPFSDWPWPTEMFEAAEQD